MLWLKWLGNAMSVHEMCIRAHIWWSELFAETQQSSVVIKLCTGFQFVRFMWSYKVKRFKTNRFYKLWKAAMSTWIFVYGKKTKKIFLFQSQPVYFSHNIWSIYHVIEYVCMCVFIFEKSTKLGFKIKVKSMFIDDINTIEMSFIFTQ